MQSTFYQRCFQLVTAGVLGYLLYQVLRPLFGVLGWAAVLAFILYPLHEWLSRKLKGRATVSAGVLTGLTPFLVLTPLSIVAFEFAGQVSRLLTYLRGRTFVSTADLLDRLSNVPVIGSWITWLRQSTTVSAAQVQGWARDGLESLLKSAASMGGDVALGVFGTLAGFFMMLFMLFFFLRDGRRLVDGLTRLIPAEPARRAELINYLGEVTRAVVFGSVTTAVIAGIIVGIGYAIVGLPAPVVFGVLGMIAAFLPSGASIVLAPAVIYLGFSGRWGAAILLTCWIGLLLISENLLRPLLTAHHAKVSTLALFVGAIGGTAAFGILGLIIGPVLLSFIVAIVRFSESAPPTKAQGDAPV
jgi:predicted PurR-regulated permease PerM